MKPDTSRWRDQDQYEFYDDLPVEGVAWECLRRNAAYQTSFEGLSGFPCVAGHKG